MKTIEQIVKELYHLPSGQVELWIENKMQQTDITGELYYSEIIRLIPYEMMANLKPGQTRIIQDYCKQKISEFCDKSQGDKQADDKLTLTACAIMHVYLYMYDKGKLVTKNNMNKLALEYGHTSGDKLRNEFVVYLDEAKRHELSDTNKRSANETLKRIKSILPHLKELNNDSYKKACEDLVILEKKYNQFHS